LLAGGKGEPEDEKMTMAQKNRDKRRTKQMKRGEKKTETHGIWFDVS